MSGNNPWNWAIKKSEYTHKCSCWIWIFVQHSYLTYLKYSKFKSYLPLEKFLCLTFNHQNNGKDESLWMHKQQWYTVKIFCFVILVIYSKFSSLVYKHEIFWYSMGRGGASNLHWTITLKCYVEMFRVCVWWKWTEKITFFPLYCLLCGSAI